MTALRRTALFDTHVASGAEMVDFGGWQMPMQYPEGIVGEHLSTRKLAGVFDVSHMGRFVVRGSGAEAFLQHVLSNNARALDIRQTGAQYTMIPNETGGAVDDAFLYRFEEDEFLLVVNAANREKDLAHLTTYLEGFRDVELTDRTGDIVMIALQGPMSREILAAVMDTGVMPEPVRNAVSTVTIAGARVRVARTGYTGEPLCFELFVARDRGADLWALLVDKGAHPVGLGARDTLRLEAGLPLYGHELGLDPDGAQIPIMACPLARFAVSFSPLKGDYVGRRALSVQFEALKKIMRRDYSSRADLPRYIYPVAVAGKGIARAGAVVYKGDERIGYMTSGTRVPLWAVEGEGLDSVQTDERRLRSIGLAYLDSDILTGDGVGIEIRGKMVDGVVVDYHMKSDAPPCARPILFDHHLPGATQVPARTHAKVLGLLEDALDNTLWRQKTCINLIPSEMTVSPMCRMLSVMDPCFRYAEHRKTKAFYDTEVFYYQGTGFIGRVERMLEDELRVFLGCPEVETRLISGQMANTAVFSAMVDYLNRGDRKREPRRIRRVMNNHIGKGGHLSSQPMGALRDFVARDPDVERPSVVNFPVEPENPYKMDVPAALALIEAYRPELIVLGKSMVLHREPVAQIRAFLDERGIRATVMYDMAHVLGLIGPHFQQPFEEGVDLVTGSTHKTYFGTQRGVVGARFLPRDEGYELWEALTRRTFPGSVSNHHLGTMLGLLMAAFEMNHFRDDYQPRVIANARAFAAALRDCGLDVAGDPHTGFTETHQVVVRVGYGKGPDAAERLEKNNIICNYQAGPDEESFTASGALRMGVAEMTRFGMAEEDFREVAQLVRDVVVDDARVADRVEALRSRFPDLKFCFRGPDYDRVMERLHGLLG